MDTDHPYGRDIKIKFFPFMSPYDLNDAFYQVDLYQNGVGEIKFVYDQKNYHERSLSKFEVSLILSNFENIRMPSVLIADDFWITHPSFYKKIHLSFDRCHLVYHWCDDDLHNFKSTYTSINSLSELISKLEPINPESIIENWDQYMFE